MFNCIRIDFMLSYSITDIIFHNVDRRNSKKENSLDDMIYFIALN